MKKSSIKNLILVGGAVVVLLVLYILFVKPDDSAKSTGLVSSNTGSAPAVRNSQNQTQAQALASSDSLLRILKNLEGLELNDSIFFNPAFSKLRDISIPLVKEGNAGRRNPFAPIGNDPVPVPVNNGTVGENNNNSDENITNTPEGETSEDDGVSIFGF